MPNSATTLATRPSRTHRITVSQQLIEHIHLFFNQCPKTIFHELFQNARRAGATLVEVTVTPEDKGHRITVTDNGCGLEEPSPLYTLPKSGWNETIVETETPAGMGLFSLSHLPKGFTAHSKDWILHLQPECFTGKLDIPETAAPYIDGMEISFYHPQTNISLEYIITSCCEYYPIPVTLNGNALPKKSLHTHADHLWEDHNCIISITKSYNVDAYDRINFQGLTIPIERHTLLPGLLGYRAQVDLKNTKDLDLVLPARNAIVQNDKLTALQQTCRKAIYEYIEEKKVPHSLPYGYYQEALSLGYDLKEAEPVLELLSPDAIWGSEQIWDIETYYDSGKGPNNIVTPKSFVTETLTNDEIVALSLSGKTIPTIFRACPSKENYSWYPKRTAVSLATTIKQTIEGKEIVTTWTSTTESCPIKFNPLDKTTHADSITLTLTYIERGKEKQISLPTFITFDSDHNNYRGITESWLPTKDGVQKVNIDTLRLLFFHAYDQDHHNNTETYETQWEHFDTQAEECLLEINENKEKALLNTLQKALFDSRITETVEALNIKTITLTIDESGNPIISSIVKQNELGATQ